MASKMLQVVIHGDVKSAVGGFEKVDAAAGKSGNVFAKYGVTAKKAMLLAGAGVVALGVGLFKLGSEFDAAYDSIRIGTGATGDALKGLEGDFRAVVAGVPNSFGDVSMAIADLNTALGLTGKPLQDLAKQMVLLSDLTGEDLGGEIKALSGLFVSFGVKASDQGNVMNELFRIYQKTGTSVTEMATAVSMGGPAFQQLGMSIEQSAAFVALFTKAGLPATRAMSSLYSIIQKAAAQGIPASEAFKSIWTEIANGKGDIKVTNDAVALFGSTLGPKLVGLIQSGKLSYQDLVDTISKGGDTIQSATDDTDDFAEKWGMFVNNVKLRLEPAANAVFNFVSGLGDDLVPVLHAAGTGFHYLGDAVKPVAELFSALPGPAKSLFAVLGTGALVYATLGSKISAGVAAIGAFAGRIVAIPGLMADWVAGNIGVIATNDLVAESEIGVGVAADGAAAGVGLLGTVMTGGLVLAAVGVVAVLHGFSGAGKEAGEAASDLASKMDGLTDTMSRSFLTGQLHDDFVNNSKGFRDDLDQMGIGLDEFASVASQGTAAGDKWIRMLAQQAEANGTLSDTFAVIPRLRSEMNKLTEAEDKHRDRQSAANQADAKGVQVSGELADKVGDVGQAGEDAGQAISDLTSAITGYFNQALQGEQANDKLAADFDDLATKTKSAAANGVDMANVWTQQSAGARDYRSSMDSVLSDSAAVIASYVQQGVHGQNLANVIAFVRGNMDNQARAAGASANAIAGLNSRYDGLARQPDIVKAINVNSGQAEGALRNVLNLMSAIQSRNASLTLHAAFGIGAHAGGGTLGEGLNIINEQGPELLRKTGSTVQVYPAGQTRSMLSPTGASGQMTVVNVTVQGSVISEHDLARTVQGAIMRLQRRSPQPVLPGVSG